MLILNLYTVILIFFFKYKYFIYSIINRNLGGNNIEVISPAIQNLSNLELL